MPATLCSNITRTRLTNQSFFSCICQQHCVAIILVPDYYVHTSKLLLLTILVLYQIITYTPAINTGARIFKIRCLLEYYSRYTITNSLFSEYAATCTCYLHQYLLLVPLFFFKASIIPVLFNTRCTIRLYWC